MAKKKNLFDPLAGYITVPITEQVKLNYDQYPNQGVRFAGYAKVANAGSYKLLKQTILKTGVSDSNITTTQTIIDINVPIFGNKNKVLYIRSLQLNLSVSAISVGSYFAIYDEIGTKLVWKWRPLRSEGNNFYFDTPLKLSNDLIVVLEPSGITVNAFSYEIQGWFEDNE
jgi:hypothetical protein